MRSQLGNRSVRRPAVFASDSFTPCPDRSAPALSPSCDRTRLSHTWRRRLRSGGGGDTPGTGKQQQFERRYTRKQCASETGSALNKTIIGRGNGSFCAFGKVKRGEARLQHLVHRPDLKVTYPALSNSDAGATDSRHLFIRVDRFFTCLEPLQDASILCSWAQLLHHVGLLPCNMRKT